MDHADPELEGALNRFIIEFEVRLIDYGYPAIYTELFTVSIKGLF